MRHDVDIEAESARQRERDDRMRAEGRAAGLEEAAKEATVYSPRGGYDDDTAGRAAMKAGDDIAAAIRALKESK